MKALKMSISFLLSYLLLGQAYAATVEDIQVIDSKNINVVFDASTVLSEGDIDSEVKVLKDISISFAEKDIEDTTKLILDLDDEIQYDSNYSLLSVLGPEGNIDFTTTDMIDGVEILNASITDGQGIHKVFIKDSKTLELFYREPLLEEEFEFKLLNESSISSLKGATSTLHVSFESNLSEYSNYILMLLSVKDAEGATVSFDEDLHNFSTQEFTIIEEVQEELIEEDEGTQEIEEPTEEVIEPSVDQPIESAQEVTLDLGEEEGNLEEISLNAARTPDTGASTSVILGLTLLMNLAIFFRKKLIKA